MLMRPNKAETAVRCYHYLGDMAVCMPDRGLVFEFVTCFYCSKRITFVVDSVKCVPIPRKIARPTLYQVLKTTHLLSAPAHPQYFLTSPLLICSLAWFILVN